MAPFSASILCYTQPPTNKLHFVIVQVSERRWVVAEFSGSEPLFSLHFPTLNPPGDTTARRVQGALGFRVVSEPLTHARAVQRLEELYIERQESRGVEPPYVLTDEPLG